MNKILFLALLLTAAICQAETLPDKLTIKGNEYTGVHFVSRDPARVKFTHDAGVANVLIVDLPADAQKGFPVDAGAAAEKEQAEAVLRAKATAEIRAKKGAAQALLVADAVASKTTASAVWLAGKVISVTDEGVIISTRHEWIQTGSKIERWADSAASFEVNHTVPVGADAQAVGLVFVAGAVNYVDDQAIRVQAIPNGTYRYEAVSGAAKTIKRYSLFEVSKN